MIKERGENRQEETQYTTLMHLENYTIIHININKKYNDKSHSLT